mmetsp:Transcript_2244/g.3852  ORF Transcript_2244/g.3852 Transcript_2244/m.3852 type:complete len:706 (-) Transcript_2244:194-2311(-)|eukprot:CAMPEP_0184690962 /NCGR_PEP_ID=MMETSP0312-20130426/31539_1 /TAXON_ID=31354 /ORGANISM="Compsopogon coeruleus, Strain SAG 36.94" /LENGTH=705 /DNA_ID=CAMNT_0027148555 /DNA_START=673 /DNA_END=2790 /DNA_ORIENTATION=+
MAVDSQVSHPLDPLHGEEIRRAAKCTQTKIQDLYGNVVLRFSTITLLEPNRTDLNGNESKNQKDVDRVAEVVVMVPSTGRTHKLTVKLGSFESTSFNHRDVPPEVLSHVELPLGIQPCFTPEDCFLAEDIVKRDEEVQKRLRDEYNLIDLTLLACDPWSVHVADPENFEPLYWRKRQDSGHEIPPRLVQTFLYRRHDAEDNHYAHPVPFLPVVDLNAEQVVAILETEDEAHGETRKIPSRNVNYHRCKLKDNDYLETSFRVDPPKRLDIAQPDGPSFVVNGNHIEWQKWSFRVGFNYREALVLHNICYNGRSVVRRASLVEMTVPYGEPKPPFQGKNAGDVADYGLGFCATSLELGCDCKGNITYFDAVLNDSKGEPYIVPKVICLHEEDSGILWKHVEYRNPTMTETRRARNLVLQCSMTVVNYEYLIYVTFGLDGGIAFDVKLTGELSTNLMTSGEEMRGSPDFGVEVAPGVNAQFHQHMFCYRLDMKVDGPINRIYEISVAPMPRNNQNPYGNAFQRVSTLLSTEEEGKRPLPPPGTSWRIENASGRKNLVNKQPTAYKLIPNTRGSPQPLLLTDPESAVSQRGSFATASLWVTPYSADQRYPAGEFPTQSIIGNGSMSTPRDGLPIWTQENRSILDCDLVLWHSFGVTHIPRVEDFPVMPVEISGFMLKPDGFFDGNPSIDVPPEPNDDVSTQCCYSLASH